MKRPICMESFPDMPPEEPFLEVEDENGKYRLSREIVEFAKQLDGKVNPYLVDPSLSVRQVEHYLQTLEKYDLIWEAADQRLCINIQKFSASVYCKSGKCIGSLDILSNVASRFLFL